MTVRHPVLAGFLAEALERAVAHYVSLDPRSRELLAPIAGKVIELKPRPFDFSIYFCPTDTSVQVLGDFGSRPDVTLAGSILAFTRLRLGESPRQLLSSGDIEIDGDMETARRFQALFEKLNVDFEAQLAQYTGQAFASTCFELFRSGLAWSRDTLNTLRLDLAEYWQEESRELPAQTEADAFYAEVDRLRADCDRLEVRIERIRRSLQATPSDPESAV
ncbi:ubiquinone biosynthesis accessory factor UbiJ [Methylocaldum szegediense]|uniref:Ubiquinone biosynthesis accessory factor UbiJ n=1 Tax=Methylocaldum szegediense TaxID=73780 RepID=A0ABN8X4C3_9GAMM|nr:SCP2 sterol-binding domain-containing protein [Methylocaldum szegediense]CAI8779385.1 ubiquinone biosynthesis protein UbiJ [Methylocaldum szegediense]